MNRESQALGKQRDYYSKAGIFASVKDQLNGGGGGGGDYAKTTSIATTFSPERYYPYGSLVMYEGQLYEMTKVGGHEAGPFNDDFKIKDVSNVFGDIYLRMCDKADIAPLFDTFPMSAASRTFKEGDYFFFGEFLCIALEDIPEGTHVGNIVEGEDYEKVGSVGSEMQSIKGDLIDPEMIATKWYPDPDDGWAVGSLCTHRDEDGEWALWRCTTADYNEEWDETYWYRTEINDYLRNIYGPGLTTPIYNQINFVNRQKVKNTMVAKAYATNKGYQKGSLFTHENASTQVSSLYVALQDIAVGTDWADLTKNTDYEEVCVIESMVHPSAIAQVWTPWAFYAHGDYVTHAAQDMGYKLYRCDNQAGSQAGMWPAADFTEVSLMDIISSL